VLPCIDEVDSSLRTSEHPIRDPTLVRLPGPRNEETNIMVAKRTVTKTAKTLGRKRARGTNYLIVGRDGTLLLASGSTGKIRALDPNETKQVLPLLRQRQQLGRQLTQLLEKAGFALADDIVVDLEI
jgi:hypothetical protein